MKTLEVINFIRTHPDWEQILSGPPYFIQIKWGEKLFEGLVLLKYNQIDSDLSINMVQECRGLILDSKDDWRVVRMSFEKFFNWGEKNAAGIDWSTARVQQKVDGCFSQHSKVTLADGTSRHIYKIWDDIQKGKEVYVLSYNLDTKTLEKKKVINALKKPSLEDEWLTLTFHGTNDFETAGFGLSERGRRRSAGINRKLAATKNHIFFVKGLNGIEEKKAIDLEEGDLLYTHFFEPTEITKQILIGSFLGDGAVNGAYSRTTNENPVRPLGLKIVHSTKQKEYLAFKYELIKKELGGRFREYYSKNSYAHEKVSYISFASPTIGKYALMVYDKNNKKRITEKALENLDWFGFAIWYMDDGSLSKCCKSNSIHLHTERYCFEDVLLLHRFFENRGYKNYIRHYRNYYMINFSTEASEEIWKKIRQYIPPCMQYKLPERHQGFFEPIINEETPKEALFEVKIIKKENYNNIGVDITNFANPKRNVYKYDLQIEENSNYFCNGVLVHNSLISTWWWPREKAWIISTNGTINAYDTKVASQSDTFLDDVDMTFGEVFDEACQKQNFDWGVLKPGCTYTFELVSPYSRVVVPYPESKIYHLATRNNETLEEFNDDIGIEKPKEYPLHSLDATIKAAEALNKEGTTIDDEGFVVVDCDWNRIKIKSPLYLTAAYMVNKKLTIRRALDITLAGERDEFLSYFPSSVEAFDELDKLIDRIVEQMERSWLYAEATLGENCSMKDFAGFVANMRWKSWCFYKKRNPDADAKTFLLGLLGIRDLIKDYWENKDDPLQWTVVGTKSKK